jgi:hypothetical protein
MCCPFNVTKIIWLSVILCFPCSCCLWMFWTHLYILIYIYYIVVSFRWFSSCFSSAWISCCWCSEVPLEFSSQGPDVSEVHHGWDLSLTSSADHERLHWKKGTGKTCDEKFNTLIHCLSFARPGDTSRSPSVFFLGVFKIGIVCGPHRT